MPAQAPLGEPERLHRRFRQAVDEDRRRGALTQLLQNMACFRNEAGMGGMVGARQFGRERMARAQGADNHRVVLVFGDQAEVVGKAGRYAQIDAAAVRLAAKKVGFHLDVAIAEQHHIDAPAAARKIHKAEGLAGRPIAFAAFLHGAAIVVEQRQRIAPIGRA